jgi:putative transposase
MIPLENRRRMTAHIETAHANGARLRPACHLAGIDVRTWQRWRQSGGLQRGDARPVTARPPPAHALTQDEQQAILSLANEPRFADLPPSRIVPQLADEGRYIASESSFYRVLRAHRQIRYRGRAQSPSAQRLPTTHIATAPGQLWCWDVTYLPTQVRGLWFYLTIILDIYSRKIIGFTVEKTDSADHAARLAQRVALSEGVHAMSVKPVLHGDNGPTVKATTIYAMLHWLGITPSHSRPRVSDDNAFAEAWFRTAKYAPAFPAQGFSTIADARRWAAHFVAGYNTEHLHSGIRFVTPDQRHQGQDVHILAQRHTVYLAAKVRNPARWSRNTRNWSPIKTVTLNPERDAFVQSQFLKQVA